MVDQVLFPIPGYEDLYWIDMKTDTVYNKLKHPIKYTQTSLGSAVELYKNGQREKLLIRDIRSSIQGGTV